MLANRDTEVPGEEGAGQAVEGTDPALLPVLCRTLPCLFSELIPRIPATPPVGAGGSPSWGHPCSRHVPQPLTGCGEQTDGPAPYVKGF